MRKGASGRNAFIRSPTKERRTIKRNSPLVLSSRTRPRSTDDSLACRPPHRSNATPTRIRRHRRPRSSEPSSVDRCRRDVRAPHRAPTRDASSVSMTLRSPAVLRWLEPLRLLVKVALLSGVLHSVLLAAVVSIRLNLSETETREEVCSNGFWRTDDA